MRRARAATALAVSGLALGTAGCSSSSGAPAAPSLTAAPGTFRLSPRIPGNGAPPQPQLLTAGTARVLVAFGGAFEQDNRAVAGMSLQLAPPARASGASSPTAAATARAAGRYPAGAVIALGTVHVHVLAVHDRSGESHDLVDLRITSR